MIKPINKMLHNHLYESHPPTYKQAHTHFQAPTQPNRHKTNTSNFWTTFVLNQNRKPSHHLTHWNLRTS